MKTLLESRNFQLRTEYQLINKEPVQEFSNFLPKYGIFRTCLELLYHELNSGKLSFYSNFWIIQRTFSSFIHISNRSKAFGPQFTVKTFSFLYACKSNKGVLAGKNLVTRGYVAKKIVRHAAVLDTLETRLTCT